MQDYFRVGVITKTHGIKGEVKVFPTTDDPERFLEIKDCFIDTGKELVPVKINSAKFFKQYVILKFKGINDINDIEKYKGKDLLVSRENATPLDEGEYYIADIIGFDVMLEDGKRLGELYDVLQTGANDVFVVKTDNGKEVLIPVINDCFLNADLEKKTIEVHLLDGLLDL